MIHMFKYIVALLLIIAAGAGAFYLFNAHIYDQKQGGVEDYKRITVGIESELITLGEEGTQFFGNEAKGDINEDGIVDLGFIFTRNTGGSGTFYYAVAALQNAAGRYIGTNAVYLGDRIAPQSSEIRNTIFVVNYADRAKDEPFSTPPSIGVSAYLYYQDGELRAEWPIQLFYYNPTLDTDAAGTILCSEKGLVAVPRLMPDATVDGAIRALLAGNLLDGEKARGITTEFPLEGLSFVGSELHNGVLTLTFDDPEGRTSGGACRATVLWKQIEATALQFDDVREVQFAPATLFQP